MYICVWGTQRSLFGVCTYTNSYLCVRLSHEMVCVHDGLKWSTSTRDRNSLSNYIKQCTTRVRRGCACYYCVYILLVVLSLPEWCVLRWCCCALADLARSVLSYCCTQRAGDWDTDSSPSCLLHSIHLVCDRGLFNIFRTTTISGMRSIAFI